MSPLFRRGEDEHERTPEERARDRAEREARRAAREGRPAPSVDELMAADPLISDGEDEPGRLEPLAPADAEGAPTPGELDELDWWEPGVAVEGERVREEPVRAEFDYEEPEYGELEYEEPGHEEPVHPEAKPLPREPDHPEPVGEDPKLEDVLREEREQDELLARERERDELLARERERDELLARERERDEEALREEPDPVDEEPFPDEPVAPVDQPTAAYTPPFAAGDPLGRVEPELEAPEEVPTSRPDTPNGATPVGAAPPDEETAYREPLTPLPSSPPTSSSDRARSRRDLRRAAAGRPDAAEPPRPPRRIPSFPRTGGGGRAPGAPRPSTVGRRSTGARVLAVLALAFVAFAIWFLISLFQPFKGEGSGSVIVRVPPGATVREIGNLLSDRDVVSSGFFFSLRARLSGTSDLKPGFYSLREDMAYDAAIDELEAGPPKRALTSVTMPEGRSRRESTPKVRQTSLKGSYLAATKRSKVLDPRRYGARRARSLEGFLFPATYRVQVGGPVDRLVDQQLEEFKQRFRGVDLGRARRSGLTPYEVVIIASMVEREAALRRERPIIAAVIYNRLKKKMPLAIDATIRYAANNWTRPLTESELAKSSPYNTRKRTGLPPTPIGSPGLASLKAAAKPARVSHLFYVVKPGTCGAHAFSSTDAKFLRDKRRYDAARAQKGGKSPDSCPD